MKLKHDVDFWGPTPILAIVVESLDADLLGVDDGSNCSMGFSEDGLEGPCGLGSTSKPGENQKRW